MLSPSTAPLPQPVHKAYIDVVFMLLGIIITIIGGLLLVLKAWMVNKDHERETLERALNDMPDADRSARSATTPRV